MMAGTPACRIGACSIALPGKLTPPEGFVSWVQLSHHHGLPGYLHPGMGDTKGIPTLQFHCYSVTDASLSIGRLWPQATGVN